MVMGTPFGFVCNYGHGQGVWLAGRGLAFLQPTGIQIRIICNYHYPLVQLRVALGTR